MTEALMDQAIAKMKPPREMGVICIDITNKCDLACSNCTRLLANQDYLWEMTVENFRTALRSLKGYHGIIAVIGGNPAMHSNFEELCSIFVEEIPNKGQRGLWTNNIFKHTNVAADTFGHFNLNPHGIERGIKSLETLKNLNLGNYHEEASEHAPLLVAVQDIFEPEEMWDKISQCDINKYWSAAIIQLNGNLRAYFCEVAASFDIARNQDHGIEVIPGWWEMGMDRFAMQVKTFCPRCGCSARLKGSMDYEECDSYSVSNEDIALKSLKKKRVIKLVEASSLEFMSHKATDYSKKLINSDITNAEYDKVASSMHPLRLVVFVHTCKLYEESRAKRIEQTWANVNNPNIEVIFITDNPSSSLKNSAYIGEYPTGPTYHPLNVLKMFKLFEIGYKDRDWFMIIDDDSYLYSDKLYEYLSFFDPSDNYMIGDFLNWPLFTNYASLNYKFWVGGGSGIVLSKSAISDFLTLIDKFRIELVNHDLWLHQLINALELATSGQSNALKIKRVHAPGFHQYGGENLFKKYALESKHLVSVHLNGQLNLLDHYHR